MSINLPFDIEFTLTRGEIIKSIAIYVIIHGLLYLYMNINKVIVVLVNVQRKKLEKEARNAILKQHVYEEHPDKISGCLRNDCAMLTSQDI